MQYRMLGPLEVVADTRTIDLGSPKQRALLAVLLLERGRIVAADRIVESLWGDSPPPSVSASLQAYVSNLRRLLRDEAGSSPIERRSPGYVLDAPADDLDRTEFLGYAVAARDAVDDRDWPAAADAARSALALWRGPVLAEQRDEPWVQVESVALEQRRLEVSELLVTALLGTDRAGEAASEAQRLVAADPLREHAIWLLMVALYRAERTVEALEAYREHARRLDEELGLEPAAAIRDLHTAILRQAADIAAWPNAPRTPSASPAPEDTAPPRDISPELAQQPELLVGRDGELAMIEELVESSSGTVRWLVLTGPAGIGKTRLAEQTATTLTLRGARVVRAGCPEDDGTPPWWPVRQLVRALGADSESLLTPPPDTSADVGRYAVYERLEALLVAVAEQPTVVVIDDAQWADRTSLKWLAHLAEAPPSSDLTFILTVRDEVPSPELDRLLAAIARRALARQIVVPPLALGEIGELATRVSGDPIEGNELSALAEQTGGNPFFIGEYARLPRDERASGGVPVAVRSVLRRRLAGVDADVLQVLRTAAVLGDPIDVQLLGVVARLEPDDLADLLDEAADQHLIRPAPAGSGYQFAHGLLRNEVLAGLSLPRRQRLHVRIADALTDGAGDDLLSRRATHLRAALPLADPRTVFDACRAAAIDADDRWESESAAEWWAAASTTYALLPQADQDDEERDDLLIAHVAALSRAGRRQTLIGVVEQALLEAVRHDRFASAGRLASATLRTSGVWPWASFSVDAGPLLTRLAGIEPLVRSDPGAHARVLAALAVGSYYDPDPHVPDRLSARGLEIAERLGDPDVIADALWGRALCFSGLPSRAAETVQLVDRLHALPHRLSRMDDVLRHTLLTLSLLTLGDVIGVEEHLAQGITGSDALRLSTVRVQLRWIEGALAAWHGHLDLSEKLSQIARDRHRETELYLMNVDGFATLGRYWEQGRLTELPLLELKENPTMPWLKAAQQLARGQLDDGIATLRSAAQHPPPEIWTTLGEIVLAAHLVADTGVHESAELLLPLLEPHRGHIGDLGQTAQTGPVDLALARLHALVGDRDAASEALERARRVASSGGGRCALLRCRLLAAEMDGASADELIAIAKEADDIGMSAVADRARGLKPRVRVIS